MDAPAGIRAVQHAGSRPPQAIALAPAHYSERVNWLRSPMRTIVPIVVVDDRFVVMTFGHVLSCELYGRDSCHIANRLCAIQCGNPSPEIPDYVQAGRIHRIEQRRKPIAVTVDDGRIFSRMYCFPSLSPGNRTGYTHITDFAVDNSCPFGIGTVYVNMDVWYARKSGESRCRPLVLSVDIPGDKIRTLNRNVCGRSAIPHDPCHLSPHFDLGFTHRAHRLTWWSRDLMITAW